MKKSSKFKVQSSMFKKKNVSLSLITYHISRITAHLKNGFTLIELLVVISIIVTLMAIGITSYSTVQSKARDSKRKSDIADIQSALEQYYSVCNYVYPAPDSGYSYENIVCVSPSIAILENISNDPRSTPYYCPTLGAGNECDSGNTYKVCTILEAQSPAEYCLTNKQ
ncbi:hypothetical protein A2Y99_03650 [Candidatus Gottesmanbacteria bacterium RBG_13_37_7]|uniref:Type II secretion system protein GspG C-terminal domain-containing protein n=1 Tax=Candidatus Gottesmanbacteria bacterium RBG_13_37_7 TaxID=1798369 RepID=A0A1F5YI17_9BACT|nr:MAG: hypothetical protein A2Y99_03650 [Candidatus Gottesmanbacteria bacterium RBG_13_37_7]